MPTPLAIGVGLTTTLLLSPAPETPPSPLIGAAFAENLGQEDPEVRFRASLGPGAVFALERALVLRPLRIERASGGAPPPFESPAPRTDLLRAVGANVWLHLEAAAPGSAPVGRDLRPGVLNYFRGPDPDGWVTDVPRFGSVSYPGVQAGIDLAFAVEDGGLRPAVTLAAGADLGRLRLRCEGARELVPDGRGGLWVDSHGGALRLLAPRIERVLAGGAALPLEGSLRPGGAGRIAFTLGPPATPAWTPVAQQLVYSKFLGGEAFEVGHAVALLETGSLPKAHVSGYTASLAFKPALPGPFDTSLNGAFDAFVARYAGSGNVLAWANYLGGSSDDYAFGVAVDGAGNTYVSGITASADFPVTAGTLQTTFQGGPFFGHDAWVSVFDSAGANLTASTYLGGTGDDQSFALAIDSQGNAVVGGLTLSLADFPLQHALQPTYNLDGQLHNPPDSDGFLTVLTPDLSTLVYSTYVAGLQSEVVFDVAVDLEDRVHVVVETNSTFMLTQNPVQASGLPFDNCWIGSYGFTPSPPAMSLDYGTFLCGSQADSGHAIAVDADGYLYVAGYTSSGDFPTTPGAFDTSYNGKATCSWDSQPGDSWAARIDWDQTSPPGGLVYSTYLGGDSCESAWGIATDGNGLAYVAGETGSTGYPTTAGAFDVTFNRGSDAALSVLTADGSALVSSTFLGARNHENAFGVAVPAGGGHAFLTGQTESSQFPVTGIYIQPPYQGATDAFVTKITVP